MGQGIGAVTSCLCNTRAVAVPVPKAAGTVWLAQERIPELTLVQLGEVRVRNGAVPWRGGRAGAWAELQFDLQHLRSQSPKSCPKLLLPFSLTPDCRDQTQVLREQLGLMFAGDTRAEQNGKELVISFTSELTVEVL